MNYYQHKIYCDLDYKTLLSIAADYFESIKFYGSDKKKFKNNSSIYKDDTSSLNFSVAAARSLFDESGDIFVISENLKGKFSRKEISKDDLPLKVRQRFKNIPNILKIDLHLNFYQAQYNIVEALSKKLRTAGYDIYDDCFNGQLLGFYDNHLISENERLEAIHLLVEEYFLENSLPPIDLTLFSSEMSLLVSNLEVDSIRALKTAEYLRKIVVELPDYSPIIIEYCKIIEIEIYHKILIPTKIKMQTIPDIQTAKTLKNLKTFVQSTDNKSIELGTFSNMLSSIIEHNLTDELASNLINIVSELPFKRKAQDLVNDIYYLTRNFRNKAAHKSILTKEDMNNCRNFIIGYNGHTGLLSNIVNIG